MGKINHYSEESFYANIEVGSGLKDGGGNLGTSGQVLSSTGTGTDWITLPSNTDNYVDSVSFTKSTSTLTLGRTGALADLTVIVKSIEGDVVSNLNSFISTSDGLLTYDRFSNNPTGDIPGSTNNANGILTMYSHSGPYGKQMAFGDNEEMYIRKFSNNVAGTWRRLMHDQNIHDVVINALSYLAIDDVLGLDANSELTVRTPAQFVQDFSLVTTNTIQTITGTKTFTSNITANSFIKSGGTSAQFLKADGSVDTNTYLTSIPSTYVTTNTTQDITGDKRFTSDTVYFGTDASNSAEVIIDTTNGGSPQISFTESNDASWAIGVDDTDNSFKVHGASSATIPIINNLATPLFEVTTTAGTMFCNGNKIYHAGNDGVGSGLDADTLDGIQGSSYVRTDTTQTITGSKTFTVTTNFDAAVVLDRPTTQGGALRWNSPNGAFISWDARSFTTNAATAVVHKFCRDSTDSSYSHYQENWYDSGSYIYLRATGGGTFAFSRSSGVCNVSSTGTMTATNFILSSDKNLKENIENYWPTVINVDWKTYELKSEKGQKRYGVIAQDLLKTHPEFVRQNKETKEYSVAYVDLLVAKVAELEAKNRVLEERLDRLESIIENL